MSGSGNSRHRLGQEQLGRSCRRSPWTDWQGDELGASQGDELGASKGYELGASQGDELWAPQGLSLMYVHWVNELISLWQELRYLVVS